MSELLPGESGPRRRTEEPREVADANDEARRLAQSLGVASSEPRQPLNDGSFSPIDNTAFPASTGGQHPYNVPGPLADDNDVKSTASNQSSYVAHVFNAQGQRAPHYDGPYYVQYTDDGRRIQKRWCKSCCCDAVAHILYCHTHTSLSTDGRLEDGYLAWSSIYLHEYFGFRIYHPLTPDEQMEMKKDPDSNQVPPWITKLTALPNMAIILSYFCTGVALQLLRTPLIVYLIEDRDATPAQVNVLFTVSK